MLENVITEGLMRLVLMIENTVVPFMHTIGNTPWLIRANELPDELIWSQSRANCIAEFTLVLFG